MGKRGPKPTPSKILELRGTRRKDREAPNAPEPEPSAPECPSWLSREVGWGTYAQARYQELAPQLEHIGVLTEIDRDTLVLYCDAYGRWRYWRQRLEKAEQWTQETESGFRMQQPEVGYMNQAKDDMKKFGALLGLSPSDRRNVSATPPASADPAEDFLFPGRTA